MNKLKTLLELYIFSFKIGAFVVGGGYAMLPIIHKEIIENKKWISEEELTDYLAVAQSLPGAIVINTMTFIGNKIGGKLGALSTTLGVITAPYFIIVVISMFYDEFQSSVVLQKGFEGVRAVVVALIIIAVLKMAKPSIKSKFQLIIAIAAAFFVTILSVSPIYIVVLSGIIGIIRVTIEGGKNASNN